MTRPRRSARRRSSRRCPSPTTRACRNRLAAPAAEDVREEDHVTAMVEQPAKVMRIGTMIKQLLEEVRAAPLDEAGRQRLREIHESSITRARGRPVARAARGARPADACPSATDGAQPRPSCASPRPSWSAGSRGCSTASRPRCSPSRWPPAPSWRRCADARCRRVREQRTHHHRSGRTADHAAGAAPVSARVTTRVAARHRPVPLSRPALSRRAEQRIRSGWRRRPRRCSPAPRRRPPGRRVRVGDRVGAAGPAQHRHVVGHVADRDAPRPRAMPCEAASSASPVALVTPGAAISSSAERRRVGDRRPARRAACSAAARNSSDVGAAVLGQQLHRRLGRAISASAPTRGGGDRAAAAGRRPG